MLKKRIIPCLDIQNGRTVKGTNFVNIRDAGDPVELAAEYAKQGADELVFLDITATVEKRKAFPELVKRIAQVINIPFTVGGGINSLKDVSVLIQAGADKVSINSSAVKRPELISQIAKEFGSQCVVTAIDTKHLNGEDIVFVHGGRTQTSRKTVQWAKEAENYGAGEILLSSMDHDGTKNGFGLEITNTVSNTVNIPVIASGGAGNDTHFYDVFINTEASAALAASIFHFGEVMIPDLKNKLQTKQIPIR
jgi:cyclase